MKKISYIILLVALACWSWTARATAAEAATEKGSNPEFSVTPVVTYVDVSGNASKFREHWWMKDGISGGIERFELHQKFGKDGQFNVEGRGIYNQRDYDVRMELVKPDFGFLRLGFTQYPKYFENTGGYFAPFAGAPIASPFNSWDVLGRTPQLDIGKIYFDAGLTLPNLPKFTFGYEHQYKDGSKNLLEWGTVRGTIPAGPISPNGDTSKKIFPALKDIDERVDIFKLGVEHTIGPVNLGDDFYFEKYGNETVRSDDSTHYLADGTMKTVDIKEDYYHDLFSNVFHVDHHVNDKVYWSAGYLFTHMSGNSDFAETTYGSLGGLGAALPGDAMYLIPRINLRQESQVGNLSVMVGPFADLTGYAGAQVEATDTDADLSGNYGTRAAPSLRYYSTGLSKRATEETAGLRYTRIPYTTLFAEAKWNQQSYGQQVERTASTSDWGVDADVNRQQYTAGFNTSPWARVTFSSQYRYSRNDNVYYTRYNPSADYASFIRDQEFVTDEITSKLTYRPFNRVSLALKYQLVSTSIDNTTEPVQFTGTTSLHAFDYYANIYSLNATWTPINRLYLTGLFSYQDTTSTAYDNGSNIVVPYKGGVYSAIGSAGYAIDNKTDATAEYSYSRSDNYDNNGFGTTAGTDYGIPYGISYDLQGLTFKLTRRINDHIVVGLRYGFYKYNEANTGDINDYTAHLASASCTIRF
ncbi:MAG: hypothetical protein NT105_00140 [Verrucomicrobia bacterium]|nr:hypothetical protein [Verrucomicrobiota bacterium]